MLIADHAWACILFFRLDPIHHEPAKGGNVVIGIRYLCKWLGLGLGFTMNPENWPVGRRWRYCRFERTYVSPTRYINTQKRTTQRGLKFCFCHICARPGDIFHFSHGVFAKQNELKLPYLRVKPIVF